MLQKYKYHNKESGRTAGEALPVELLFCEAGPTQQNETSPFRHKEEEEPKRIKYVGTYCVHDEEILFHVCTLK